MNANYPTLYLAGPMTGLPDDNRPAFAEAAAALRAAGYEVVNPAENGLPAAASWEQHMRTDIINMLGRCDAVATLPGIEASRGGILETGLATGLGWRVHTVEQWLELAAVEATCAALLD